MIETVTPPAPVLDRPAPGVLGVRGPGARGLRRRLTRQIPLLVWLAGAIVAVWLFAQEPARTPGSPSPSRSLKAGRGILPP